MYVGPEDHRLPKLPQEVIAQMAETPKPVDHFISPESLTYILVVLFIAGWFRQTNKRLLKLIAAGSVCVSILIIFALDDCRGSCRYHLAYNIFMVYIVQMAVFLFWAYLFYFVRFMVRLARKKETLPKISISDLKERLYTYWEKLKYGVAKAKSLAIKAGTTNILLAIISVLLLAIVAKLYRW